MKREGLAWLIVGALAVASILGYAVSTGVVGLRITALLLPAMTVILVAPALRLATRVLLASAYGLLFTVYGLAGAGQWPIAQVSVPAMLLAAGALFLAWKKEGKEEGDHLNGWLVMWICALVIGVLIALLSGPSGSSGRMREVLEFNFRMTSAQADTTLLIIRKSVHILCYGASATLAACGWSRKEKGAGPLAVGALWSFMHAAFDEWNQASFADRTGTPVDLLWDGGGIVLGLFISWLFLRRRL